MDKLILIYLSNTMDSLQKIVSTNKVLRFLEITVVKNKFFRTIGVHKSGQLKLLSDFFKILVKELIFREAAAPVTLVVNYLV